MNLDNSIWKLLKELEVKKGITEIILNNQDSVYIERAGEMIRLNTDIKNEDFLSFAQDIAKMNNSYYDQNHPIVDGNLPDGSRVNIISSLYTKSTPAITIRKYLKTINSFDELNGKFGLSNKWLRFFKTLVQSKHNIIISGGTNMGKTTFMNLLLNEIGPKERIVTIEDTRELKCDHPNRVGLFASHNHSEIESPLQIRQLIKNSLRMRPDRIIIGEVRGEEAFDLLQAMNTGHDGSMCTIHANNPPEVLSRLESLFTFAGYDIPLRAIRGQMANAIDFIIQLGRSRNGDRIVTQVYEVTGMEGDVIVTQSIGEEGQNGPVFSGLVPKAIPKLVEFGLDQDFFIEV